MVILRAPFFLTIILIGFWVARSNGEGVLGQSGEVGPRSNGSSTNVKGGKKEQQPALLGPYLEFADGKRVAANIQPGTDNLPAGNLMVFNVAQKQNEKDDPQASQEEKPSGEGNLWVLALVSLSALAVGGFLIKIIVFPEAMLKDGGR